MPETSSPPGTAGGGEGLRAPLWRAIALFRLAALAYVVVLVVRNAGDYARPVTAWLVVAAMAAWTAATAYGYADPRRRRWPLLVADLAVTAAVLLATPAVVGREALGNGVPTLAVAWLAAPVFTWAVSGGRRWGLVAALALGGIDVSVRRNLDQAGFTGAALMLLAAITVGYLVRLVDDAERRLERAVQLEAATRERERLARDIHDSVLQVLALVRRRGAHLDGEAGELARLAGEQEAALRALVTARAPAPPAATIDLLTVLDRYGSSGVSIASPAGPVRLPAGVAAEIAAAVAAALDNVARHAGPDARAWVLVEDEPDAVTVSVRDDGCGVSAGRLAEAHAQGRLGVAQSVQGRIAALGGEVRISSTPGQGTEVELRVPRRPLS